MALNFREMPTGGKRKKGDRVMRNTLPMNLQLFADGGYGNGGQNDGGDNGQAGQQGNQNNQQTQQQQNANLQNEVVAAQKVAEQAQIELAATKVAMTLGINAKTLPYVLKMADFSKVKGTDGKISEDNVKAVLEQVIKDVPALKPIQEGRLTLT